MLDLRSGRLVTLNPGLRTYLASTVKVPILLALLRKSGGPSRLTPAERRLATKMIERSSNDAASKLWRAAGGNVGLRRLFDALRLPGVRRAPELLTEWDGWRSGAVDQVRLMASIARSSDRDSGAGARYVLGLMRRVEPRERWGISAGRERAWRVALKNGWVPVPGHRWTVNSVGVVDTGDDRYCLAVLTSNEPSIGAGKRATNLISDAVASTYRQ